MPDKREQIVAATRELLERHGYHATGLKQIISESGAPRGSLYYYFPGGKEELAAEAIERTGRVLSERIRRNLDQASEPAQALRVFIERIAAAVEASEFSTGGPLTAVAMETASSSETLNLACRQAFQRIEATFAKYLEETHVGGDPAELATMITAAIEGGIILSRTYHSGEPLRRVARLVANWVGEKVPSD